MPARPRRARTAAHARIVTGRHYGRTAARTYAAGLSAGGYLVRWQLEHHPELYTGGIDWNALIFTPGTNLLTTLRAYPAYANGDTSGHDAMLAAGYPAGSEPAWGFSHTNLWVPLQHQIRAELDPSYDDDEAAYDLASRPASVRAAVARLSLSGRLGRPLVSVQGALDALTPPSRYADTYDRLIAKAGRTALHREHRVPGGVHTDGLVALAPTGFQPVLPRFVTAFAELGQWTVPSTRVGPAPEGAGTGPTRRGHQ